MRILPIAVWAAALALGTGSAHADGLIRHLPEEDGAWVEYFLTVRVVGRPDTETTGILKVSSIRSENVDGTRHRWIELNLTLHQDAGDQRSLFKLLLPGDRIADGEPLEHVAKGWLKRDGEQEPLPFPELRDLERALLQALLPGSIAETAEVDEFRRVDYQRGRLECPSAVAGREVVKTDSIEADAEFTVWPHEEIPFGTAAVKIVAEGRSQSNGGLPRTVLDFVVNDFGTGAESELPDRW